MIDNIVDCAWANSPDIDPVASIQKHTSINPKAGIGKWSFDLVLKIVFLIWLGTTTYATGLLGIAGLLGLVIFPFLVVGFGA